MVSLPSYIFDLCFFHSFILFRLDGCRLEILTVTIRPQLNPSNRSRQTTFFSKKALHCIQPCARTRITHE